jgi:transcription antitermination factor NusG
MALDPKLYEPRTPGSAEERRRWFALSTFSNSEKQVAKHLQVREIETFLPLQTKVNRWKNRTTVKVEVPLFTGYIFARIALSERTRVLEVPNVVSIVGSARKPLPLADSEVETLRRDLHLRCAEPHPYLTVGKRARIVSGPLAGMEGVVLRTESNLRLVLSFELLMRSIAVRVNADEVEACN